MSSATKTLELLSYFSISRPELGLSQLSRLAKRDKATTHRHLQALEDAGFVEQNPLNKLYRLGPVVLQLAQTREVSVPRKISAESELTKLCDATGETAHVSVLSGSTLYPLTYRESVQHSTRVIINNKILPLHATASGLCALAFGPSKLFDAAVANLHEFTPHTISNVEDLLKAIQITKEAGFGHSDRFFEADVVSIAAPVFDQTGLFAGAVSVASVATRLTPDLEICIRQNLKIASEVISRNWGGRISDEIQLKQNQFQPTQTFRNLPESLNPADIL